MSKNNFMWAQGKEANLTEPIRELAENGWRHRDIPKASNMNWIFKQISDDLVALRKDAELGEVQTAELRQKLVEQSLSLQEQKESISALKAELETLSERHVKFEFFTSDTFAKAYKRDDFNTGISRQICLQLWNLVASIKAYHPNFPHFLWPLREEAGPRADDESTD